MIERLVDIARHVVPRGGQQRIDNGNLPPSVLEKTHTSGAAGTTMTHMVEALKAFDTTVVTEEMYRSFQAPNWRITDVLAVVPVRYNYEANAAIKSMVPWTASQRQMLASDGDVRVQVRLFSAEGKEIRFVQQHQLIVNREAVTAVLAPAPRKNLKTPHWAPAGLDISRFFLACQNGPVQISFVNVMQTTGVLVVQLVNEVSIEALASVVPVRKQFRAFSSSSSSFDFRCIYELYLI